MQKKALRTMTIFSLAFVLMLPVVASAEGRHQLVTGRVHTVVVPTYPYWGYGWGWGDPFWAYGPYYPVDTRGQVKIKDADKYDQVYVDGAYAGTVSKVKNMRLNPGNYDIQVSREGRSLINRNVYVVSGKTVHIDING